MSEFIFVIPSGWQQVSAYAIGEIGSRIGDWLTVNDLTSLSDALKEYNEIGPDAIWLRPVSSMAKCLPFGSGNK